MTNIYANCCIYRQRNGRVLDGYQRLEGVNLGSSHLLRTIGLELYQFLSNVGVILLNAYDSILMLDTYTPLTIIG